MPKSKGLTAVLKPREVGRTSPHIAIKCWNFSYFQERWVMIRRRMPLKVDARGRECCCNFHFPLVPIVLNGKSAYLKCVLQPFFGFYTSENIEQKCKQRFGDYGC